MSLDEHCESLETYWSSLSDNWEQLAELWNDSVRLQFEEQHWRQFETAVPPVLRALRQLHEVITDALRVVDSLD